MPPLVANSTLDTSTKRFPSGSDSLDNSASHGDSAILEAGVPGELLGDTCTTRVVVDREIIEELRTSDPRTADRLDAAMAEMPKIGDDFEGFQLVQELGHGAFGRVFLARQNDLAQRFVALKIAVDLRGESQNLARLQHTNIVPIYSEHRHGDLQAVCMPYFGSATLANVCKQIGAHQSLPTSGRQLIGTLLHRQSTFHSADFPHSSSKPHLNGHHDDHQAVPSQGPMLAAPPANLLKIEQMSYVDAVLWIASRLADGLAHAHERGIIHRDLKPANVLLCDDGQPMLLDFNLAEVSNSSTSFVVAQMGGTPPYMSPEQLSAYIEGTGLLDCRGDIYALGLILYHLLTGRHAFPVRRGRSRDILPKMIADRQVAPPSLRVYNRSVSPAVEAIIQHCLEPNPDQRYASACDLAEDIERHRANLPLKHIHEPSLIERAVKWTRRHPRFASPASFSALTAAVLLAAAAISVQQSLKSRARELELHREQALDLYHTFQGNYHLAQDLLTTENPTDMARGLKHAEKALNEYQVVEKANWFEQPNVQELSPPDRERLKAEVGETAFLMARALHLQPNSDNGQAKQLNDVAGTNLDDNAKPAVAQQRAVLDRKVLDPEERQRLQQMLENAAGLNVRGRFLLACNHSAEGRHQEALRIVDRIVVEEPNDFGAWSLKARCHQMLDQDVDAIAAYGTAIALRPNYARSYVARASALFAQQTRAKPALQDLNQALRLQPNLLEARIDRALVLLELGRYDDSLSDLDWAVNQDQAPARAWFIRSRVRRAKNNIEGSRSDRERGLRTEPTDAISWVSRGFAKLPTDHEGALADFIQAEAVQPRCIEALNNQAYVYAVKLKQPEKAIAALDRLLRYFPDNPRAIGYRAILLARTGQIDEAIAEVRQFIKSAPGPEHLYRIACVFAIASAKNPALKTESLRLLATVLSRGWGHDRIDTDNDLNAIRDMPEFKRLTGFTREIRAWSGKPN